MSDESVIDELKEDEYFELYNPTYDNLLLVLRLEKENGIVKMSGSVEKDFLEKVIPYLEFKIQFASHLLEKKWAWKSSRASSRDGWSSGKEDTTIKSSRRKNKIIKKRYIRVGIVIKLKKGKRLSRSGCNDRSYRSSDRRVSSGQCLSIVLYLCKDFNLNLST